MEQKNYLKIVWILAFVAFASVSCWATTESLRLLLTSWPAALCWVVSIGFFIIASIGTKMIVDSLNQNIYLEKRGLYLVGGILILIVFWLVCSMPTNTHTFVYRTIINDKVEADISNTQGYLSQIKDNTNNVNQAYQKVNKLNNDVDILLGELEAEIKNETNPGFGTKSKEILRKFAPLLGVDKIEPLSYRGSSKQDRAKLCDAYRKKIYILRDSRANSIKNNILSPNEDALNDVNMEYKNLSLMRDYIKDNTLDLNDPQDIEEVCSKLNISYNTIKKNKDFVNFASETDEAKYTANSPVTDVKQMISVFNVWQNYIAGEYSGHGFIFWIIVSILVDIAAFIFFDLAFRKTED